MTKYSSCKFIYKEKNSINLGLNKIMRNDKKKKKNSYGDCALKCIYLLVFMIVSDLSILIFQFHMVLKIISLT